MPVDIMLDIARFHHANAIKARERKPRGKEAKAETEQIIRTEHAMALSAADKVAPFYHPKLATLQSNVNLAGRLTLEQLVERSYAAPANSNVAGALIDGDAPLEIAAPVAAE